MSVGIGFKRKRRKTGKETRTIRRARVEGSGLALGNFNDLTVELAGGGLVKADLLGQPASPDGIEETKNSKAINLTSVLSHLEGDLRHDQNEGRGRERAKK